MQSDIDLDPSNPETHLAIAEIAVQYSYCTIAESGRVLLEVQSILDKELGWSAERIWVDAGPLDATEWQGVLAQLRLNAKNQKPQPTTTNVEVLDLVTHDRFLKDHTQPHAFGPIENAEVHPEVIEGRYVIGKEFGRGGGGKVVRAFDRQLERVVAMKLPTHFNPTVETPPLHREATTTSRLEHPNIVPIYDAGRLHGGQPFYTMRRVSGHSLREALSLLRKGDTRAHDRWPLEELLRTVTEVTRAMEYVHYQNIIHRDLKPENIMLGDFGEVYVMDWGLAIPRDSGKADLQSTDPNKLDTVGTPAYMSPEQASGGATLDVQSDVYSLGVVLYEALTFIVPSRRDSVVETLLAVASEAIVPPSKVSARPIDPELDQIVMRALERNPADRYQNMREFRQALQQYTSGKRPRTAAIHLENALQYIERYDEGLRRCQRLRAKAQEMAATILPSDSIQTKRASWRAEERVEEVEKENAAILEHALNELHEATRLNPNLHEARNILATLGWRKHQAAQENPDSTDSEFFRSFLKQHDITGNYTRLLDAPSKLRVFADTDGVQAFIQSVEHRDRRKRYTALRHLGPLPLQVTDLPRGSWRLILKQQGVPAIHIPISAHSEEPINVFAAISMAKDLPEGFRLVPNGTTIIGGDRHALAPLPRQLLSVPTFAALTRHLLMQEYLEWIQSLSRYDARAAALRLPTLSNNMPLFRQNSKRDYYICPTALHHLNPEANADDPLPVVGIRARDAEEYVRWRSSIDNRVYRLPREEEYERMARGADGRVFPWGNRFDPALCTMVLSFTDSPRLRTVGHAHPDIGAFGHRDLAGNVREICTVSGTSNYVLRGGSWLTDSRACRATSRILKNAHQRADDVGFRLVLEP